MPTDPTTLSALDLWRDPSGVAALLDDWREKLAGTPIRQQKRTPPNNQGGVGRQQQQHLCETLYAQQYFTTFDVYYDIVDPTVRSTKKL